MDSVEQRTIAKVSARLVPFLVVCYFIAFLDRVNVGFAALTMNKALGLNATAFGFGAGIFFLAYFFFEVPSNLLLERFGARKWIARIMFTWGVLSGLMAFIPGIAAGTGTSTTWIFYIIRMALGAAEAGFFPGIIFYLTLWFPAVYRAQIYGYFIAAIPLSSMIGAPVSGMLLNMDGLLGLAGWQWLFIIEALPSLLLAFVVFFYLTDRPSDATWLATDERAWLMDRLDGERQQREMARSFSVMEALGNTRVLLLSCVAFGVSAAMYGVTFFLPQIVHGFGLSFTATGFVTAIPYVIGIIGMVYWSRKSDRMRERKEHLGLAILVAGVGIAASTLIADPTGKMIALSCAGLGIFAAFPVFWTLPAAFLSGAAAAGGIAVITSIGNLAGFVAPYVIGAIKDATGSFTIGLLVISALTLLSMLMVLSLPHDADLEKPPAT